MKLFYAPGASSLAAHISLREVERTFELERVDLRSHRTASGGDFLTINPKGYVPALQLDGLDTPVLTELAAVLQYIADLAPEHRLAPAAGTFARYHLQEWLSFIAAEIHKQFAPLSSPDTPPQTEARARTKLAGRFAYVDSVLADRPYLMGETFSVADAFLVVMLRWCERYDLDLKVWPNLDNYFRRVMSRPSVQAALHTEGLLESKRYRRSA